MLGRALGIKRWISLVVLTLGVSVVSLPSSNSNDLAMSIHDFSDHFFPRSVHELGYAAGNIAEAAAHLTRRGLDGLAGELTKRSATYEGIQEDITTGPTMNYSVGLTAVLISAAVSGLTGVYFEKVLKDSATDGVKGVRGNTGTGGDTPSECWRGKEMAGGAPTTKTRTGAEDDNAGTTA